MATDEKEGASTKEMGESNSLGEEMEEHSYAGEITIHSKYPTQNKLQ